MRPNHGCLTSATHACSGSSLPTPRLYREHTLADSRKLLFCSTHDTCVVLFGCYCQNRAIGSGPIGAQLTPFGSLLQFRLTWTGSGSDSFFLLRGSCNTNVCALEAACRRHGFLDPPVRTHTHTHTCTHPCTRARPCACLPAEVEQQRAAQPCTCKGFRGRTVFDGSCTVLAIRLHILVSPVHCRSQGTLGCWLVPAACVCVCVCVCVAEVRKPGSCEANLKSSTGINSWGRFGSDGSQNCIQNTCGADSSCAE